MMNEDITILLMHHLDYLKKLADVTNGILSAAKNNKIDLVSIESKNKDRIINILCHYQDQINLKLNKEDHGTISQDFREILLSWSHETDGFLNKIDKIDQEIVSILENRKKNIHHDIISTNKSRIQFKGYNLKNVRR